MAAPKKRTICVFCGSRAGNKPVYEETAKEFATELVKRSHALVYGGGSIGLMGAIARTVNREGGAVTGVIPEALMPREVVGEMIGKVIVTQDMHERKKTMAELSDAFVALPGGYGTLEELFEVTTWHQLGIHRKPVGLLNINGYFDSMLTLVDKAIEEGFITPHYKEILVVDSSPVGLLQKIEEFVSPLENDPNALVWLKKDQV
eukprot:TRINITY_DN5841_c0_g1_i1.p1 TRINITY_DN5841_c0_g1~~TRINITY_DN5841_c0_g1_i1.p1  ORF type:complete len:204 (+),score=37.55 TRINITY_DN5841_c0_g1_i1:53-664(+)